MIAYQVEHEATYNMYDDNKHEFIRGNIYTQKPDEVSDWFWHLLIKNKSLIEIEVA